MKYSEIGRTGMVVSELSFGCSSLGGVFRSIKEQEAIEAVFTAIECGINFLDVSPYYGHYKAETVLGKALKSIPRDKYYLSTKVGRYGKGVGYPIEKLAMQFATDNPRIATTLFSSANPDNVRRNVAYVESETDAALLEAVMKIIEPHFGERWNNT